MKTRTIQILAIAGTMALLSCQKDPQKDAQYKANKDQNMADRAAERSADAANASADNAANAAAYQAGADINQAIANVNVPKFDNLVSNEMVKKIGNHINDFVNAKNYKETGEFVDKLNHDQAELDKKVKNGSISTADADQIKNYVSQIEQAVGATVQ